MSPAETEEPMIIMVYIIVAREGGWWMKSDMVCSFFLSLMFLCGWADRWIWTMSDDDGDCGWMDDGWIEMVFL